MNKQKGFTIIELIVVIAIIAVLAAIVLVNVTQYINKGKDAAIQGNMASILTNAAQYVDTNGSYGTNAAGVCQDATVVSAMTAANTASGGTSTCTVSPSAGPGTAFCACSPLKNSAGNVFCVDSTGFKRASTTGTSTVPVTCSTACPSTGICAPSL